MSTQVHAKIINVFWWNIGANSYSQDLGDYTTLDETFLEKDFSKYDVVALGEFKTGKMYPEAISKIQKLYPHRIKFRYNKTSNQRIYLLSKYPVETMKSYVLDWVPASMSEAQKKNYKTRARKKLGRRVQNFIRSYNRITLRVGGQKAHLVFYHLNNPWPGYIESSGRVGAAAELLLGTRNPLMYQIQNFQRVLQYDLGKNYRKKPVIMMGDSNCASSVKRLPTACIKRMRRMMPVVMDHAKLYTFPADSWTGASKYPRVKIDHAQSTLSGRNLDLTVLEWDGSDHYPIALAAKLN